MGLLIDVFRPSSMYDCTNGGVSATAKRLCVVNVDGPFDPSEDAPAVKLQKGPLDTVNLVPVDEDRWVAFGGNFGYTSDSRFQRAVESLIGVSHVAVAIHDRVE